MSSQGAGHADLIGLFRPGIPYRAALTEPALNSIKLSAAGRCRALFPEVTGWRRAPGNDARAARRKVAEASPAAALCPLPAPCTSSSIRSRISPDSVMFFAIRRPEYASAARLPAEMRVVATRRFAHQPDFPPASATHRSRFRTAAGHTRHHDMLIAFTPRVPTRSRQPYQCGGGGKAPRFRHRQRTWSGSETQAIGFSRCQGDRNSSASWSRQLFNPRLFLSPVRWQQPGSWFAAVMPRNSPLMDLMRSPADRFSADGQDTPSEYVRFNQQTASGAVSVRSFDPADSDRSRPQGNSYGADQQFPNF